MLEAGHHPDTLEQPPPSAGQATALHWAAWEGQTAAARVLIEANAGLDFANANGWTALHLAMRHADPAFVQALLAAGADPDAVGKGGTTALHWAVRRRDGSAAALVTCLIDHDADPGIADAKGRTPLDVARHNPQLLGSPVLNRLATSPEPPPSELDGNPSLGF